MRIESTPAFETGTIVDSSAGESVRIVGRLLRGEVEPLYTIVPVDYAQGETLRGSHVRAFTVRESALLVGAWRDASAQVREDRYAPLKGGQHGAR